MERIKLDRRGRRCPYCHDDVDQANIMMCTSCDALHHPECASGHGKCSSCGLNFGEVENKPMTEKLDSRLTDFVGPGYMGTSNIDPAYMLAAEALIPQVNIPVVPDEQELAESGVKFVPFTPGERGKESLGDIVSDTFKGMTDAEMNKFITNTRKSMDENDKLRTAKKDKESSPADLEKILKTFTKRELSELEKDMDYSGFLKARTDFISYSDYLRFPGVNAFYWSVGFGAITLITAILIDKGYSGYFNNVVGLGSLIGLVGSAYYAISYPTPYQIDAKYEELGKKLKKSVVHIRKIARIKEITCETRPEYEPVEKIETDLYNMLFDK